MSTLPRWNMESIYPSVDSPGYARDLERICTISSELGRMAGDEAVPLKALIDLHDEGEALLVTVTAYAEALLSVSASDPGYLRAVSRAEEAAVAFAAASDAYTRAVAARNDEYALPELRMYRKVLEDISVEAGHLMSPAEESLASELSRSGSSAWERLMASVTSAAEAEGRTLTELRALASSGSRDVRKKAFGEELALLKRHSSSFAYALSGVKGSVLTLDAKRGWEDPYYDGRGVRMYPETGGAL